MFGLSVPLTQSGSGRSLDRTFWTTAELGYWGTGIWGIGTRRVQDVSFRVVRSTGRRVEGEEFPERIIKRVKF